MGQPLIDLSLFKYRTQAVQYRDITKNLDAVFIKMSCSVIKNDDDNMIRKCQYRFQKLKIKKPSHYSSCVVFYHYKSY